MPRGNHRNQYDVEESKYSNYADNKIVQWIHGYIYRNKRPLRVNLYLSKVEYELLKEVSTRMKTGVGVAIRGCALAAASMYLEARNIEYSERRKRAIATTDESVHEALRELAGKCPSGQPDPGEVRDTTPPEGVLD